MQHEALAHLHLPDALLSFWRADVLTYHASKSSVLFYCFTETCSNERYCSHVTHQLHLYSTPPHAQMLPWNYCSLTPFCSNTSSVHWFYSSTWDCYCNILEYLYDFFCKGNAHRVLLPGDQQFQFISFQTCFHSVTEWKAHLLRAFTGLYFAKLLTCRIKKTSNFGLENQSILYPWETRSFDP